MIEQSAEEIAAAMAQDPLSWAKLYLRSLEIIRRNYATIEQYQGLLEMHKIEYITAVKH